MVTTVGAMSHVFLKKTIYCNDISLFYTRCDLERKNTKNLPKKTIVNTSRPNATAAYVVAGSSG